MRHSSALNRCWATEDEVRSAIVFMSASAISGSTDRNVARSACSMICLRFAKPAAERSVTRFTTAAGAVSGEPASNGGAGAYSSCSWIACAASSPTSSAAIVNAKSMPAVTPPPVTRLPSRTTRSRTGIAPSGSSNAWNAQCVVARRPRSRPAICSTVGPWNSADSGRSCLSCF